jgi:transcriptional regulator with XRE-family HTH domain
MPARIYPKRQPKLYLAEWRESLGLTQQQLGDRLATSDVTVSRWETGKRRPDNNALAAICEALGIPLTAIYRHPDTPSADELLAGQPPEVWNQAIAAVMRTIRARN